MAVAVTAVVAAIEVTTVATVLSAVAAVGMATTVVGIVTGKPNLVKIGGTLSLVGGVGGMINSAYQNMAAGALEAGVAEGAAEGAFSDVAGEKFAIAAGQDAAGSGFGASAGGAAANGLSPVIAGTSDLDGIISAAQNGTNAAPATSAADITAATGSPIRPGAPDLSGTELGSKSNGFLDMHGTPLSDAATPTLPGGTTDIFDLPQTHGLDAITFDKIKASIGEAWESLSPNQKDMVVKQAMAIPGGIQSQRNKERELDIMDTRNRQSSYGSDLPTFGIIAKAQTRAG